MDDALTAALDSAAPADGEAPTSGDETALRWLASEALRPGGWPAVTLDEVTALVGAWATARGWAAPTAPLTARAMTAAGFRRARHGRGTRRYSVAGREAAQRLADAARQLRDGAAAVADSDV